MDASLTIAALYYFLSIRETVDKNSLNFGIFASLAFINRVDSLIYWPIVLLISGFYQRRLFVLLKSAILTAFPLLCFSILIDSLYYGKFVFSQLNNLLFNVIEAKSDFFGVSPWYEYVLILYQDKIFFIFTICSFVHSLYSCIQEKKIPYLVLVILNSFVMLSSVGHKEDRFLLTFACITCILLGIVIEKLTRNMN